MQRYTCSIVPRIITGRVYNSRGAIGTNILEHRCPARSDTHITPSATSNSIMDANHFGLIGALERMVLEMIQYTQTPQLPQICSWHRGQSLMLSSSGSACTNIGGDFKAAYTLRPPTSSSHIYKPFDRLICKGINITHGTRSQQGVILTAAVLLWLVFIMQLTSDN